MHESRQVRPHEGLGGDGPTRPEWSRRVQEGSLSAVEVLRVWASRGWPERPGRPAGARRGSPPGHPPPSPQRVPPGPVVLGQGPVAREGAASRQGPAPRQGSAGALPEVRHEEVAAALADLDRLVGLEPIKRAVREFAAHAEIRAERRALGLAEDATTLHMVFTGHPGTGKTTVARILGRLFWALGLLSRGHLVEVERAHLVGEYIGHTAIKTRETIRKAQGGVLFVDEAYSLARGGDKDFGREALDALVKGMEDLREALAVILAGYPLEMQWFLAQNPGLRSRVANYLNFPDYNPSELLRIAEYMLASRQYVLAPAAAGLLKEAVLNQPQRFQAEAGNARAMRNLLDRAIRCHALRLAGRGPHSREELMTLTREDVQEALLHSANGWAGWR